MRTRSVRVPQLLRENIAIGTKSGSKHRRNCGFWCPSLVLITVVPRISISSPCLPTRAATPGAPSAEEEPSAEAAEEDLQRALEAIDTGLVAFSSDEGAPVRARGAVPYYRLHKVVAAAVTRKAFILGGRRGEELPNLSSVSNSSSMTILMDADNLGETIKTAMDGNMSFVFQVDVDLACEETFYVTDAKTGELTQGRNKSIGRIHRIRLESCTTPNESIDKTPAWKVIDLDGWLNGNSFC
ncbi:unnamed protein product [Laminaria digitata]